MITANIKHIFFDLDHTLWDFDKNSGLTFEKIFKLHKIDINIKEFLAVYEPINLEYWKRYREERVTKEALRFGRLNDAFKAINFKVSNAVVDTLSEAYITHLSSFNYVFDGTHDILKYLKEKYQLHIITNGFEEVQEKKMKASSIIHYFNTITNSEMVGVKKPNPKIFNHALALANANPKESVMIGDNLEADIEGAQNIGMQTILFDYKDTYQNYKKHRVTNLNALKTII